MDKLESDYAAPDMIDVLVADHRAVEAMFAELGSGLGAPEYRGRLRDVVIAELVRHAVAEEEFLYPAVREALPDGDGVVERGISEHAGAERLMKNLETLGATDERFDVLVSDLVAVIRHHMEDEESDVFPRLRRACAARRLRQLGEQIELAKRTAPTRPHPGVPDRPPWNLLLAPGAGLVERVREALAGRPRGR